MFFLTFNIYLCSIIQGCVLCGIPGIMRNFSHKLLCALHTGWNCAKPEIHCMWGFTAIVWTYSAGCLSVHWWSRLRGRKGLGSVQALLSSNENTLVLSTLFSAQILEQPVLALVNKINTIPAAHWIRRCSGATMAEVKRMHFSIPGSVPSSGDPPVCWAVALPVPEVSPPPCCRGRMRESPPCPALHLHLCKDLGWFSQIREDSVTPRSELRLCCKNFSKTKQW